VPSRVSIVSLSFLSLETKIPGRDVVKKDRGQSRLSFLWEGDDISTAWRTPSWWSDQSQLARSDMSKRPANPPAVCNPWLIGIKVLMLAWCVRYGHPVASGVCRYAFRSRVVGDNTTRQNDAEVVCAGNFKAQPAR
jgi:hypothetical protein